MSKPKKPNRMKGGVVKRFNKWSYVVQAPDQSGQIKTRWVSGFPTATAARAARATALASIAAGEYIPRNTETVGGYLESWLTTHALEVRPKTLADYRALLERYVVPAIGSMALQAVKPSTLSTLYAELLDHGGSNGRPLSQRTVSYVHSVLRKAFNDAVEIEQLMVSNPALRAKRPKAQPLDAIRPDWGAPELKRFLAALEGDPLLGFFRVASYTGARRGEMLFLHWSDVHLDGDEPHIWIKGSSVAVDGRMVEGKTKTGRSRKVSIDSGTVDVLRALKATQREHRAMVGDDWPDTDLVFVRQMGTPLAVTAPREALRSTINRINASLGENEAPLPMIRLHDLRHLHATLLLKAGVPVHVVAARLGHRDPAMTLRVYAHVLNEQSTTAADKFARLLDEAE